MAPGTNIGAASPDLRQGEDIEGTLGEKVMNDAIANITAIAEARGRPSTGRSATVRDARYVGGRGGGRGGRRRRASPARIDEVLAAADGRTVTVGRRAAVTLATGRRRHRSSCR